MSTLKKIFCILTLLLINLGAHAGVVTFGGVTWDEDAGNPLSAAFTFNQWYTTDSDDFISMDILAPPTTLADIGVELFAFGEFTGFSANREAHPTDSSNTFTDGAELTFTLTGAFWDPTHIDANALGLVTSGALLNVYIDSTRDLDAADYTDWADANNDGALWASFSFDYVNLSGAVNDAQLVAGLSFEGSSFAGSEVLDTNDGIPDFLLNSSAQFTSLNGTVAARANGQITRHIPEPSILALFALGLIGLASRRFIK
jgi:hypothetical protein